MYLDWPVVGLLPSANWAWKQWKWVTMSWLQISGGPFGFFQTLCLISSLITHAWMMSATLPLLCRPANERNEKKKTFFVVWDWFWFGGWYAFVKIQQGFLEKINWDSHSGSRNIWVFCGFVCRSVLPCGFKIVFPNGFPSSTLKQLLTGGIGVRVKLHRHPSEQLASWKLGSLYLVSLQLSPPFVTPLLFTTRPEVGNQTNYGRI